MNPVGYAHQNHILLSITAKQLKAAITPIRRMVTVQKEKQKQYGNTFDFDVDAALA